MHELIAKHGIELDISDPIHAGLMRLLDQMDEMSADPAVQMCVAWSEAAEREAVSDGV